MGIPIPTRVWWTRHDGRFVAAHNGHSIEVPTEAPPYIAGLPEHMTEIDFMPAARVAQLRVSAGQSREMSPDERSALLKWCDDILILNARRLLWEGPEE